MLNRRRKGNLKGKQTASLSQQYDVTTANLPKQRSVSQYLSL